MLIAFEGLDGVGKTEHIRTLQKMINTKCISFCFPDLECSTGKIIQSHISGNIKLPVDEITRMFYLNKLEKTKTIQEYMHQNYVVLCDRYIMSGIVYADAIGYDKSKLDALNFGLIKPHATFYLYNNKYKYTENDIYENITFQKTIKKHYDLRLKNQNNIYHIDTSQSIEVCNKLIYTHMCNIIEEQVRNPRATQLY